MGADKLDEYPSLLIINFYNQSVVVLIDLKNRPVILKGPCCIKIPSNISRSPPRFGQYIVIPFLQRLPAVRMLLIKGNQRTAIVDVHLDLAGLFEQR